MSNIQYNGNFRSPPTWAGDFGGREHVMPFPARVNVAAFPANAGVKVTLTADAAADAVSLTVTALTAGNGYTATTISGGVAIPAGTTLNFGGKKFATTSADANVGATSISVLAIPTALVTGDVAYYSRGARRFIPSGTYIGRTIAERDASTAFGPAAVADQERYLTYNDAVVTDGSSEVDVELYRKGSLVKENYLPDWATLSDGTGGVQTLTLAAGTDAGTFRVHYPPTNLTTGSLAWNVSAADLQTALRTATGDATLTVGLVGEVYTVTFTEGFGTPEQLVITNDTTNDGGVAEGGIVVAATTGGGTPLLDLLRQDYECIVGKN